MTSRLQPPRSIPAITPAPPSGRKVWMQPGTMVRTASSPRKRAAPTDPRYWSLVDGGRSAMGAVISSRPMNVVNQVYPRFEQLAPLLDAKADGPIQMVNLLKFHEKARYPDGRDAHLSGREAYMRYIADMRGIVEGAGGRFLFSGDVEALVIGDVDDLWDAVGIVEYPSRAEFHRLATSPDVQAIGVHREAGLAGQLLILTRALEF